MTEKSLQEVADYIVPLDVNGLSGRMLEMPAPKRYKREILIIYGHHALLERWWGLAQSFNDVGAVTMPDLPGFGGMDPFFTIGKQPTIDNYADYLAAFVKMRYKRRRFTVVGISFGFVVVTRMLQKYPELAKKVDLVVSIVGFMHRDDFLFKPRQRTSYAFWTRQMSRRPIAWLIRYGWLNRFTIRQIYIKLPAGKRRFLDMDPEEFDTMMDFEVKLWQANDVRTHWQTTSEFLKLDNCQKQVDLPSFHVASSHDHYFDNDIVEQHMRVVFNDYQRATMKSKAHTPSVLGDKKDMSIMVPPTLRKELRKRL